MSVAAIAFAVGRRCIVGLRREVQLCSGKAVAAPAAVAAGAEQGGAITAITASPGVAGVDGRRARPTLTTVAAAADH
ncbi:hypothetical protein B4U45_28385 [Mycobacterium persicum]|uniref:Uncharacterized protein n=1 Tax=Mycobacterium persicum TaxID=1487726 RepID=A0A8E2IMN3_9MYCO|nr:hypothetical protein B4U45_28385 [Mycobacterium persicum]